MPNPSRPARRRTVAIEGAKILVTASALLTTIAGWAVLSSGDAVADTASVAQVVAATATPATTTGTITNADTSAPSATAVATATAVPTQAPVPTLRVRIRTRSSR